LVEASPFTVAKKNTYSDRGKPGTEERRETAFNLTSGGMADRRE